MDTAASFGFSHFFANADGLTLAVLLILCVMSMISWVVMIFKGMVFYRAQKENAAFPVLFKAGVEPAALIESIRALPPNSAFARVSRQSLEAQEYYEAQNTGVWDEATFKQVITRAMRGALDEETTRCESGLTALATIGSTAPFVGLFGTVWGIYSALIHIGVSGAGTLDKIAAPVGEALIMTGFGLFVAIPAVIAYNGFMRVNRVWLARLDRFAYEWWELLLQYARQSGKR